MTERAPPGVAILMIVTIRCETRTNHSRTPNTMTGSGRIRKTVISSATSAECQFAMDTAGDDPKRGSCGTEAYAAPVPTGSSMGLSAPKASRLIIPVACLRA